MSKKKPSYEELERQYYKSLEQRDNMGRTLHSFYSTLEMPMLYLDPDWNIIGYSEDFLALTQSILKFTEKRKSLSEFLQEGDFEKIQRYQKKVGTLQELTYDQGGDWELRYEGPNTQDEIGESWIPYSDCEKRNWEIKGDNGNLKIIHKSHIEDEVDCYLMSAEEFGGRDQDIKIVCRLKTSKNEKDISDLSLVLSGASGREKMFCDLVGYTVSSGASKNSFARIQRKASDIIKVPEVLEPDTEYEITAERIGGRIRRQLKNLKTRKDGPSLEVIDSMALYDSQNHIGFTTYSGQMEISDIKIYTRKSVFSINQFRIPFDVEVKLRDKRLKDRLHKLRLWKDATCKTGRYSLLFEDITERKQVEQKLRESEEKFRELAELLPETIFESDLELNITFVNRNAFDQFGYTRQDFENGLNGFDILSPEDRERARENVEKKLRGEDIGLTEYTALRKDGSTFPTIFQTCLIQRDSKPVGLRGFIIDITKRKQTEEALRESEELFRTLSESSPIGIFQTDTAGRVLYLNDQWCSITGMSKQDALGFGWSAALYPGDKQWVLEEWKKCLINNKGYDGEFRFTRPSGETRWVHTITSPMRSAAGDFMGYVGVNQDITERKRSEEALRESEERFRNLMEYIPGIAIQGYNSKGTIRYWNKASEHIYGYTAKEAVGKNLGDLIIPEDVKPHFLKALEIGNKTTISGEFLPAGELTLLHKDGSPVNVYSIHTIVCIEGKETLMFCLDVDLSERKQAEEALRKSEERYRLLTQNIPVGIYRNSPGPKGRFSMANQAIAKMFGFDTVEELMEWPVASLYQNPVDREVFSKKLLSQGRVVGEHLRLQKRDGTPIWGAITAQVVHDESGRIIHFDGMIEDITERKIAEEILKKRADLERAVIIISTDFISLAADDINSGINRALETLGIFERMDRSYIFQFNDKKTTMSNTHEWCAKGIESQINNLQELPTEVFPWSIKKVLRNETVYIPCVADLPHEAFAEKKEFEAENIQSVLFVPLVSNGRSIGFIGFDSVREKKTWSEDTIYLLTLVGDIITNALERERVETELKRSETQFRRLVENIGKDYFLYSLDTAGVFQYISPSITEVLGYSQDEFSTRYSEYLTDNPLNKKIKHYTDLSIQSKQQSTYEIEIFHQNRSVHRLEVVAVPVVNNQGEVIAIEGIAHDITERLQLEDERAKTAKLESIGILAGGIAHDFNNILTVILGNIYVANSCADKDIKETKEKLIEAEKCGMRAKDLTRQLLTFSKGGEPVKKVTQLQDLFKESTEFTLRGSNTKYRLYISQDLWPCEVDEGQISQVINNLIINADQAMPEGGTIDLRAENATVGKEDRLPLNEGRYAKLTIKDQGHGIPEQLLSKVFDPYFSTKQKGSGLGLTTTYSIIKRHGGHIAVESEQNVGTTFQVYLPASSEQIEEKEKKKKISVITGKILVMDDEQELLNVVSIVLEQIGHEVKCAKNGTQAIKMYREAKDSGRPFDVVILDLTIPGGMGGKETIKRLLKIDPDVKAIVSSGYSNDKVMANFRDYGFSSEVSKPYRAEELKRVLLEVMEKSADCEKG
jgi:PAS domain S-box-containing protein